MGFEIKSQEMYGTNVNRLVWNSGDQGGAQVQPDSQIPTSETNGGGNGAPATPPPGGDNGMNDWINAIFIMNGISIGMQGVLGAIALSR